MFKSLLVPFACVALAACSGGTKTDEPALVFTTPQAGSEKGATEQVVNATVEATSTTAGPTSVPSTPTVTVPTATPRPPTSVPQQPASDGHTWYTSSASNAQFYYCELDSGWQQLSAANLRSFQSQAALRDAFPSRTKHVDSRC